MSDPVVADDLMAQYYRRVLGTLSYRNFSTTTDGNITIYGIPFYYRVGLFLNVPTECIIAAGRFIKLHQIKERAANWTDLKVIDPEKPEACLYKGLWQPEQKPQQSAGQAAQALGQFAQLQVQAQSLKQQAAQFGAARQSLLAQDPLYRPPQLWGSIHTDEDKHSNIFSRFKDFFPW